MGNQLISEPFPPHFLIGQAISDWKINKNLIGIGYLLGFEAARR